MPESKALTDVLSGRIATAYRLFRGASTGPEPDPSVWEAAAAVLLSVQDRDPSLPLDPELFVASQSARARRIDPWYDLARPASAVAYRRAVRKMVRGLRDELMAEVSHADRRVAGGDSVFRVLTSKDRRLSPLGRFAVALRYDRKALAGRFHAAALAQHRACPLYREAAAGLLPGALYPEAPTGAPLTREVGPTLPLPRGATQALWN